MAKNTHFYLIFIKNYDIILKKDIFPRDCCLCRGKTRVDIKFRERRFLDFEYDKVGSGGPRLNLI